MAIFDLCYSFLLPNEDYTPPRYDDKPDPSRFDPTAHAIAGINSFLWPEQFAVIAALPQAERGPAVENFYRTEYWTVWYDKLTSNKLAAMTLDADVNQGQGWAVRFLQTACGSTVDGLWGVNTLAAANGSDPAIVVPAFIEARQARYRQVGGSSLDAWLARAAKIPEFD